MEEAGNKTGVYASLSWFDTHIGETGYDRWIAAWGANDGVHYPDLSGQCVMQQYRGSPLDLDILYVPLSYFGDGAAGGAEPRPYEKDGECVSVSAMAQEVLDGKWGQRRGAKAEARRVVLRSRAGRSEPDAGGCEMKLRKKQPQPEGISGYDYSDRAARERTAYALFRRAKNARTAVEIEWEKYNDYYNGIHDVTRDLTEFCRENDIPWLPASIPDPYILVESQIEPTVPQPEFRGRDDDLDSAMAKRREFAVRYIAENNRLSDMNTRNERRLLKLGDAFWKAYWDEDMRCGEAQGDIRVSDIPVEAVFPDPRCAAAACRTDSISTTFTASTRCASRRYSAPISRSSASRRRKRSARIMCPAARSST